MDERHKCEDERDVEVKAVIEMEEDSGEDKRRERERSIISRQRCDRELKLFSSPLGYAVALLHFSAQRW